MAGGAANPLKPVAGMAPLAERVAAARTVAGHPRLRVSAIETHFGTRFTADTIAALAKRFPDTRFVWLMGADNLAQIHRWRSWRSIFMAVPVAVLDRSPYSYKALAGKAARRFAWDRVPARRAGALAEAAKPVWVFLHQRRHPASATAIRAKGRVARKGR